MSRLYVDLKCGETLTIGGATVRLEKKSGQAARLCIDAEREIPINHLSLRKRAANDARMSAIPQTTGEHHGEHTLRLRPTTVS